MDNNLKIYNSDASLYAFKFNKFNREEDISKIFSLSSISEPRILELGCANGRDAKVILKKTKNYLGVDGADKLLEIAKKDNPNASFLLADFRKLKFSKNSFDIIIDFDSLFHLDQIELKLMLDNIYNWLDKDGLFLMDAKFGDYKKIINHEQQGKIQYLYSPQKILEMVDGKFTQLFEKVTDRFDKKWFTLILRKN